MNTPILIPNTRCVFTPPDLVEDTQTGTRYPVTGSLHTTVLTTTGRRMTVNLARLWPGSPPPPPPLGARPLPGHGGRYFVTSAGIVLRFEPPTRRWVALRPHRRAKGGPRVWLQDPETRTQRSAAVSSLLRLAGFGGLTPENDPEPDEMDDLPPETPPETPETPPETPETPPETPIAHPMDLMDPAELAALGFAPVEPTPQPPTPPQPEPKTEPEKPYVPPIW